MKKLLPVLAAAILLSGCMGGEYREKEETDVLPEEITLTEENPQINSLAIDLDGSVYIDGVYTEDGARTVELSRFGEIERLEIFGCGSLTPEFFKGARVKELYLYDFEGTAEDYARVFSDMELDGLFIFTTDREVNKEVLSADLSAAITGAGGECENISVYNEPILYIDGESLTVYDGSVIVTGAATTSDDIWKLGAVKGIRYLTLSDFTGDTETYEALFSQMEELEAVRINTRSYSGDQSERLMRAAGCHFEYGESEALFENQGNSSKDRINFMIEPCVYPFNTVRPESADETRLNLYFANYTDKEITASDLILYRQTAEGWEELEFGEIPMRIEVQPGGTSGLYEIKPNFTVPIDFSGLLAGVYKAAVTLNGEPYELRFLVSNFAFEGEKGNPYQSGCAMHMDFMDPEQKTAFENAFAQVYSLEADLEIPEEYVGKYTADELIAERYTALSHDLAYKLLYQSGAVETDGIIINTVSDIESSKFFGGEALFPVTMKEDECLFRLVTVHADADVSDQVRFDDRSLHMIKTDEGWKFDDFDLWY